MSTAARTPERPSRDGAAGAPGSDAPDEPDREWYRLPGDEVLEALDTRRGGLSEPESAC